MTLRKEFVKGLWTEHPTFRQLLGMCPTLAITVNAVNGLAMGLSVVFVLVFSCAVCSLLRPVVPPQVRIGVYTIVISTFVTVIDMILKAFFPMISAALGPFIPLIIVNCIILGRMEAFASRNDLVPSVVDALGMGLGYTWGVIFIGGVREMLAGGTLFGMKVFALSMPTCVVMILPAGGFLVLGLLIAAMNAHEARSRRAKEAA